MTERPILFSAPMVRAIIDGSKTQTRRVLRKQFADDAIVAEVAATSPEGWQVSGHSGMWWDDAGACLDDAVRCPYGMPGDRLWVREAWRHTASSLDEARAITEDIASGTAVDYRATYLERCMRELGFSEADAKMADSFERWRPSIHMPRWASRITLEITGVRVQRLQDISEADARAEGAPPLDPHWPIPADGRGTHASGYRRLWEQINGPDSWASNPWVWVVEFRRIS